MCCSCGGADSRARHCTGETNGPSLKWQMPPNCHCEERSDVAISGRHSQIVQAAVKTYRPIASVAALTERLVQGYSTAEVLWSPPHSPDVSLRGPEGAVAISGRQSRFCRNLPVIHPGPARFPRRFAPRNDNSGPCTIETMPKTAKSFPHCLGFQKRKGTHI